MDLVDSVVETLGRVLGPDADEVRAVISAPGLVTLEGMVEDEATHASVIDAVAHTEGVEHVTDLLHVKPDLADEAAPKQTEFRDEDDARAMTGTRFQRID